MSNIRKIAEKLIEQSTQEYQEIVRILKEDYNIEPAKKSGTSPTSISFPNNNEIHGNRKKR